MVRSFWNSSASLGSHLHALVKNLHSKLSLMDHFQNTSIFLQSSKKRNLLHSKENVNQHFFFASNVQASFLQLLVQLIAHHAYIHSHVHNGTHSILNRTPSRHKEAELPVKGQRVEITQDSRFLTPRSPDLTSLLLKRNTVQILWA